MKKLSDYKEVPNIGDFYKHFKGGYYGIIDIARECDTDKFLVIYKKMGGTETWARELEEFTGNVIKDGKEIKRFTWIDTCAE